MRGTRIRWDGALKAVGIGLAALVALLVLPGLLAGEPPPPPEDVGLVTAPPPAPPAATPTPGALTKPRPPKRAPPKPGSKREESKPSKPEADKPDREKPRRSDDRKPPGRAVPEGSTDGDREVRSPPTVAAPSYAPPATAKERFGFER